MLIFYVKFVLLWIVGNHRDFKNQNSKQVENKTKAVSLVMVLSLLYLKKIKKDFSDLCFAGFAMLSTFWQVLKVIPILKKQIVHKR